MQREKKHWYDGAFYEKFIVPHQEKVYKMAAEYIGRTGSVLDVACATGGFSFIAANLADKVTGIDLSSKNIREADKIRRNKKIGNVDFVHGNALELNKISNGGFNWAFISYALHEMPPEIRIDVLKSMKSVSDKLIIVDYSIPQPLDLRGISNYLAEFFAGPDHFSGFVNYYRNGGLEPIVEKSGLKIKHNKTIDHFKFIVAE